MAPNQLTAVQRQAWIARPAHFQYLLFKYKKDLPSFPIKSSLFPVKLNHHLN